MRSPAALPHSRTLNDAASQLDRLRGAPSPDDVQVDGRSLAQLLAFAARFGSLVTFYDLTNRPLGDWSAFFLSDPAVAGALHGSLDLPDIATGLRGLLDELRRAEDHRGSGPSLVRIAAAIVYLIQIHDKDAASDLPAPTRLTGLAGRDRRDPLGEPMRRLRRTLSGRDLTLWIAEIGDGRHGDWLDGLLDILEELIAILIEELERGAEQALAQAEASLAAPGHAPQAALYNAFALLFDEARHAMNRLPRRLLDFYYGDILKQCSRKAVPDQLYLVFTLATGVTQASVPKGTRFSAGTDPQGLAIDYAAEESLEVTAAAVSSLAVQRVLFQDADGWGDLSEATGILTGTVAAGDNGSLPAAPFPAFGGSAATATDSLTMQPASIGFAVMANALMLCGGDRSVSLSLQFKTSGNDQEGGQDGGQDGDGSDVGIADAIAQSFSFYYSTAGGWMLIDASTLSIVQQTADTVVIDFALPADAPPLVTLSTEPAADALPPTLPDTVFPGVGTLPTVLAQLRSVSADQGTQSSVAGYFLLSRISVSTVSIAVQVTGLPPDALSSPSGPLDPTQTFGLFGSPPVQNATLSITAAELFVKQVTALSLSVDWSGLPVTTTGFLGYYRGYVLDADGNRSVQPLFDNGSFRVTVGVASPGGWTLPAGTPLYLFQTAQPAATDTAGTADTADGGSADGSASADGGAGTAPAAGTAVLPTSVLTAPSVQAVATPPYYNPSSSALLLTLVEPSYAFGDVLYSSNLTAAADANIATVQARSQQSLVSTLGGSSGQIAKASKVNASASGKDYAKSVGDAVSNAVSALNGDALAALQQAVAQSGTDADGQSALLQSLQAALEGRGTSGSSSKRSRWSGGGGNSAAGSVTAGLSAWLADHQGDLAQADGALLQKAQSALAAAGSLDGSLTAAKGQSDSVARPSIAAALQNALVKIQSGNPPATQSAAQSAAPSGGTGGTTAQATSGTRISVPNPPWQPNATALTISYSATEVTPLITVEETVSGDSADGDTVVGDTAAGTQSALNGDGPFWHLDLFHQTNPAHDGRSVPLLPSIPPRAALYIDLSAAVSTASLLIVLQASSGGWTTEQPRVLWEQKVGRNWRPARLLSDSTNDLMNTGIVSLQLFPPTPAQETTSLRVTLIAGMDRIPYVKSVTTNALTARWIGPGGAEQLGTPLPAGTVTQSVETIDGIGGIDQPEDSEGGSPLAVGPEFDLWMAERLRHKGFAIDGWDYARLVLADFPSLWQVAVVPATDGDDGRPAPGHVWVVAVAGPSTPNVSDKTEPMVSPSLLADIGELLETVTSPFVTIRVTNPPYVRLTVVANLVFSGDDTATAYEEKLSGELVEWLSPWPSPGLGLRPPDYYSREAIADFVRNRPYVRAVLSLCIETDGGSGPGGWSYLTSATSHKLRGMTDEAPTAAGRVRR